MEGTNKKLYDKLISTGRVTPKEIGDFNTFNQMLQDPENCVKLYNNLRKDDLFSVKEIGDQETFFNLIEKPQQAETYQSTQPIAQDTTNRPFIDVNAQMYKDFGQPKVSPPQDDLGIGQKLDFVNQRIQQREAEQSFLGKIFDTKDEEIESLASNLYERSQRHMNAVKGEGGTGVGDVLSDRNFWTLGASDMSTMIHLKRIANKIDRNEPLKENEKLLLDAWATNEEVNQMYPLQDAKRGYQVGRQVTEMVPWLVQFAATRGAGDAAVRGIQGALRKGAQKYLGKTLGKVASRTVAEVGGAYGASALMPQTYGDIIGRTLGDTQRGPDGNVSFNKETADKPLEAIYKGWTNNMLEVLTERLGDILVDSKIIPKVNLADKIKGETGKKAAQLFNDFTKAVGWNGAPVEFLEEWINVPLNALLVGDSKFSDMFDLDQQFTTFLTVVAMGSAMGVGQTSLMKGASAIDQQLTQRDYKSAKNLYESEINEELRKHIDQIVDNPDIDINQQSKQLHSLLSKLDDEKSGIILNYVVNKMKAEGAEMTSPAEQQAPQPDPMQQVDALRNQAHQEAYNQVNSMLHNTGKFVTVTDQEGNILHVKSGDLNDPDGMLIVYEQEEPIHVSKIANWETREPQEVIDEFIQKFDTEIENKVLQPQVGETVQVNGENFVVAEDLGNSFALMDQNGSFIEVPKDQLSGMNRQPETTGETQSAPVQGEGQTQPQPKQTVVNTATIGKTDYQYTVDEAGTFDIQIPEKMDPAKAEKEIRATLPKDQQNRVQVIKEERETPPTVPWGVPTKETIIKGIRILPQSQPKPETSEQITDEKLTETGTNVEKSVEKLTETKVQQPVNKPVEKIEQPESLQKSKPGVETGEQKLTTNIQNDELDKGNQEDVNTGVSGLENQDGSRRSNIPGAERPVSSQDDSNKESEVSEERQDNKGEGILPGGTVQSELDPLQQRIIDRYNNEEWDKLIEEVGIFAAGNNPYYSRPFEKYTGFELPWEARTKQEQQDLIQALKEHKVKQQPTVKENLTTEKTGEIDREKEPSPLSTAKRIIPESKEFDSVINDVIKRGEQNEGNRTNKQTGQKISYVKHKIRYQGNEASQKRRILTKLLLDKGISQSDAANILVSGNQFRYKDYSIWFKQPHNKGERDFWEVTIEQYPELSVQQAESDKPEILNYFNLPNRINQTFPDEDRLFNYIATQVGPLDNYEGIKKQADDLGIELPYNNRLDFIEKTQGLSEKESVKPIYQRFDEYRKLKKAESEVNTNPTEAQKEAGNYKKGHVKVNGFDITIETPKGAIRKGDGWQVTMNNSYGYYNRTNGTEGKGEQVDVFLGPDLNSDKFFIVDQVNKDGSFDEHKVMQGFNSKEEASEAYLSNYEKGWKGLGAITELSKEKFSEWLKQNNPNTKAKRKPVSEMITLKKGKKDFNTLIKNIEKAKTTDELSEIVKGLNDIPYEIRKDNLNKYNDAVKAANERIKKAEKKKAIEERKRKFQEMKERGEIPDRDSFDGSTNEWISQFSEDPQEIFNAYQDEENSAPYNQLTEWQKEALNQTFRFDDFTQNVDRNYLTQTLIRAWLKKDGRPMDTFVSGNEYTQEEGGPGVLEPLTLEDLTNFILQYPDKNIRKTTDLQNDLRTRYRDVTGISINNHVNQREITDTQADLEKWLKENDLDNWMTPEDVLEIIEENRDKLTENDYIAFKNHVEDEIRKIRNANTEWWEDAESGIPEEVEPGESEDVEGYAPEGYGEQETETEQPEIGLDELVGQIESQEDQREKQLTKRLSHLTPTQQKTARESIKKIESSLEKAREDLNEAINDYNSVKNWIAGEKDKQLDLFFGGGTSEPIIVQGITFEVPQDFSDENIVRILKPLKQLVERRRNELSEAQKKIEPQIEQAIQTAGQQQELFTPLDKNLKEAEDRVNKKDKEKAEKPKEYKYHLTLRPFDIGTYPKDNFIRYEDDGTRYGVVVYSNPLPQQQIKSFQLNPITEIENLDGKTVYSAEYPWTLELKKNPRGYYYFEAVQYDEGQEVDRVKLTAEEVLRNISDGNYTFEKPEAKEKSEQPKDIDLAEQERAIRQERKDILIEARRAFVEENPNFNGSDDLLDTYINQAQVDGILYPFKQRLEANDKKFKDLLAKYNESEQPEKSKFLDEKIEQNKKNTNFVKNKQDEIPESVSQGEQPTQNEADSRLEAIANRLEQGVSESEKQGIADQRDAEARIALDYAKENNLWIDDIYTLGTPFAQGNEATIVINPEEGVVYKSNNLMNTKTISNLLNEIKAHNELFPETRYDLVGFTGIDNGTKRPPTIEVVLKQQLIDESIPATEQEIEDFMTSLGFEKLDKVTYSNKDYEISDLLPRNVLKDNSGNIYVVDSNIIKSEQYKSRIAKSAAENNLKEIQQKGSIRVADPEAVAKKIKQFTSVDVIADTESGVVKLKEESAPTQQKIEDFGEKIGGARKDVWQSKLQELNEITDNDLLNQPLSTIIPIPDYKELISSGQITGEEAALLHYYRSNLGKKPNRKASSYKKQKWLKEANLYKDLFRWMLNKEDFESKFGKSFIELSKDRLNDYAKEEIENFEKTLLALGFPETFDGNLKGHQIKRFIGRSDYSVVRGNIIIGDFKTFEQATAALRHILEGTNKKRSQVKFDAWSERGKKGIFVGKKVAAGKYITLAGPFENPKEAFAHIKENRDELIKKLEDSKIIPEERPDAADEREGRDYRQGKDVTPEMFNEAFGFRGVEFGNYVENKKRQQDLNNAYDALMDLSNILNIPSKAISLGGELGLAFGARGRGGKKSASAHYETDKIVINLTKEWGAGSLAHEWWHAVDNYFSRRRGQKFEFLTERPQQNVKVENREVIPDDITRIEVINAFKNISDVIKKSGLPDRSKDLDTRRTKDYWSQMREMSARSFESYVKDKLAEQDIKNDYLVSFKDIVDYIIQSGATEDVYPYPNKEEQESINKVFDNFFNTIETKEEDGNVVMFRIARPFYSPTEKALERVSQKKGTPDQFKAMLLKNGAKQAELDYMGWDEFVSGKKNLTKAEVQEWIDGNKVEIKEVEKVKNKGVDNFGFNRTDNGYIDNKEGYKITESNGNFDVYLPDGNLAIRRYDNLTEAQNYIREQYTSQQRTDLSGVTKYSQYQLPGGTNYKEVLLTLPYKTDVSYQNKKRRKSHGEYDVVKVEKPIDTFKSSHWEELNVLAHVRLNDRTDIEGRRLLHAEEMQADKGQEWQKLKKKIDAGIATKEDIARFEFLDKNFPFNRTPEWTNLILRRLAVYAAENGYDGISWTPGEQQAERYKEALTREIKSITPTTKDLKKSNSVKGLSLFVRSTGGDIYFEVDSNAKITYQDNVPEQMGNFVGKELSEAIGKDAADQSMTATKSFETKDIIVRSEGMKTFYNSIVPNQANKIFKKFGAKVGTTTIDLNEGDLNLELANESIEKLPEDGKLEVSYIPITQKLYDTAMGEGFPMFKPAELEVKFLDKKVEGSAEERLRRETAENRHKDVKVIADRLGKELNVKINTVATFLDLPDIQKKRAEQSGLLRKGTDNFTTAKGYYDTISDQVWIISENIESPSDAEYTILHELVGHYGLRELLGDRLRPVLQNVWDNMTENERARIQEVNPHTDDHYKLAEEYLANRAELDIKPSWWQKIISEIRDILRKVFPSLRMTSGDIDSLLAKSKEGLKKRKQQQQYRNETDEAMAKVIGEKGARKLDDIEEAGARLNNLSIAREMEKAGKTAKEIKVATGWEKGVDKKWRYEIDDNLEIINLPKVKEGEVEFLNLSDVIKDEQLFKAYPQIKNVLVAVLNDNTSNRLGAFSENILTINNNEELLQKLLHRLRKGLRGKTTSREGGITHADVLGRNIIHELQHIIQNIEGFQPGGSTQDALFLYQEYIEGEKDTNVDMERPIIREDNVKKGKALAPEEIYKRFAGEVEARNAETRLNFTPEQRRNTLLSETEDVAREDQLFIRDNLSADTDLRFKLGHVKPVRSDYSTIGDYLKALEKYYKDNPNEAPEIKKKITKAQNAILNDNGLIDKYIEAYQASAEAMKLTPPDPQTAKETLQRMREFWVDMNMPIRRWQEEIVKRGGKLPEDVNPYRDIRNMFGRMEALYRKFQKENMDPIKETIVKLTKAGVSPNGILSYMIAKHGIERNREMREQKVAEWKAEFEKKNNREPSFDEILEYTDKISTEDFSGIRPLDPEGKNKDKPVDELAEMIVAGFEKQVKPELVKELWDNVKKATDFTLDTWLKGGQITKKQYNHYKTQYENFVPLRGWREDAAKFLLYKNREGGIGKSLKHAQGRKSLADNPLVYIQTVNFKAINEQVQNEIKQETLKVVFANYGDKFKDLHKIKRAYLVKSEVLNEETQETEEAWILYRDENGNLARPPQEMFNEGLVKTEVNHEHEKLRTIWNAKQHEIVVRNDGGFSVMIFDGKSLPIAQALNGQNTMVKLWGDIEFDAQKLGDTYLFRGLATVTNFMKAMMTSYNPVFTFTNFLRDQPEAAITQFIRQNSRLADFPTRLTPIAAKAIVEDMAGKFDPNNKYHQELKNFYEAGGTTGFTHEKSPERLEKEFNNELKRLMRSDTLRGKTLDRVVNILKYIEHWNRLFEDTTRFAVYLSAREKGLSVKDSAFESRNASVDFNMKGKGTRMIEALFAFFKAGTNALQKNFQLAKNKPAKFAAVSATVITMGFIEAMANDWSDDDDDEKYYRLNDYVRENYFVMKKFWGDKGQYLRVPLPQFWRGFHAMGVSLYDFIVKDKITAGQVVGKTISNMLAGMAPIDVTGFIHEGKLSSDPLWPTFVRPVREIVVNRDFMGNRIAYEAFTKALEEDLADSGLHKKNVNPAAKFLTDMIFKAGGGEGKLKFKIDEKGKLQYVPNLMDVNPSKVEHLITGYLGGTGKFINDFVTTVWQLTGNGDGVELNNVPFLNTFIRNIPEEKWNIIRQYQKYQKYIDDADKYRSTAKGERNIEGLEKYFGSDYAKAKVLFNAYDKRIGTIMERKGFDSEDASQMITDLMRDANTQLEKLNIKR